MLHPQKTKCCNKHVSKATIQQCEKNGDPCPFCFSTAIKFRADPSLQEKTRSAKIYCPYKLEGCHWEGEIMHVSNHLHGGCWHSLTKCPHSCGASTQRHSREKHLQTCTVYNTPLQCQHCGLEYSRSDSHEDVCPNIPVCCPYKCGKRVERCEVKAHLKICDKLQTKTQNLPEEQIYYDTKDPEDHTYSGLGAVNETQKDDKNFRPAGYKLLGIAKKMIPLRSKLPTIRLSLLETRIQLQQTKLSSSGSIGAEELESEQPETTLRNIEAELQNEEEQIETEIAALRHKLHQAHREITITS